jgi:flagellar L-ring protein precursor FlgH
MNIGDFKMKSVSMITAVLFAQGFAMTIHAEKKPKTPPPSELDRYVAEATKDAQSMTAAPGALWSPGAQYADLGRDLKASQLNDLVTIIVSEQASAVSSGATQTGRQASTKTGINGLAGQFNPAGRFANLIDLGSTSKLDGKGTTSRQTTLSTVVSARVAAVLPNGYLLVEGSKNVQINAEAQTVTIRGIVRPGDLASDNSVESNRLAQMEVKLNGKGVVNDAIKRPFFLFRILSGLF